MQFNLPFPKGGRGDARTQVAGFPLANEVSKGATYWLFKRRGDSQALAANHMQKLPFKVF